MIIRILQLLLFSLGFGNTCNSYQPKSLHPAHQKRHGVFGFKNPLLVAVLFCMGIVVFVVVIFLVTGGSAVESGIYYNSPLA